MPRVKYYGELRRITGSSQEVFEAQTVKEVMLHIKRQHGLEAYNIASTSSLVVNGQNWLFTRQSKLEANDDVQLFPPVGGG